MSLPSHTIRNPSLKCIPESLIAEQGHDHAYTDCIYHLSVYCRQCLRKKKSIWVNLFAKQLFGLYIFYLIHFK